jgi:hypothetical protein
MRMETFSDINVVLPRLQFAGPSVAGACRAAPVAFQDGNDEQRLYAR